MFWSSQPIPSCQEGGRHNFESMLVKETPPTPEQIREADVEGCSTAEGAETILNALTAKEYVICCTWCGQKAES